MKKIIDLVSRYLWLQLIAVAIVFFGVSRMVGASLQAVEGTGRMAVSPTSSDGASSDLLSSEPSLPESHESVDESASWPSGGFGDWNTSQGAYSPSSKVPQTKPSGNTSKPSSQVTSKPASSTPPEPSGVGPDVSFVESGPGPDSPDPNQPGDSSPINPTPDGNHADSSMTPGGADNVSSTPSGGPNTTPGPDTTPGPGPGDQSSTPLTPGMEVSGEYTSSGALTPDMDVPSTPGPTSPADEKSSG